MTNTIDNSIGTTIPAGLDHEVTTASTHRPRTSRRSRWLVAALAAIAISVPVTKAVNDSGDGQSTGGQTTNGQSAAVDASVTNVAGLPGSPDDLRYAAEWARRVNATTPPGTITAQPATPDDLRYAAEWARRVNATTPPGTITAQPATPDDLRYAAEWARRVNATTPPGTITAQPATPDDLRYAAEWARRVNATTS